MVNVVIVDDNEADRYMAARAFEEAGVVDRMVACENGEQAFALLSEADRFRAALGDRAAITIVLLDINLPRMSGFDVLRRLGEQGGGMTGAGVKVFLYTSSNAERDREAAAACPLVDGYIVKPLVDLDQVRDQLGRYLDD